jgi:hypothetical protein
VYVERNTLAGSLNHCCKENSAMRYLCVAQLYKTCATGRKVEGSIPDEVSGILSFARTVALGSTLPLREMSTKDICEG